MGMDRDVIVQVLLRERVRLTASAVVIARDVHAADDIFQQVVLAALQAAEKFQDAHHVLAWALRAARHRAIDLAHQRRLVPLPDDVLDLMETDWSDPAAWSDQAEILRLRYAEGMTAVAIARRLRRTADAVYQMLSRTHRALRQCVDRELSTVGEPAKGGVS
jgi:RNA polymerase sigma-70 factor (ECF subfamily)